MEIKNYFLKLKNKELVSNSDLYFYEGKINHIVGKNGVGKSQLAKDFILNRNACIPKVVSQNTTLISSSSNVPNDISKDFLFDLLKCKFNNESKFKEISKMLNLESIPSKILIKNLSDGQKQKLKLLSFLLEDKSIIILDEITNALDKKTVNDIYSFLNKFISDNPSKVIINITHNLSDLSSINGAQFLFKDKRIEEYTSKDHLINDYINL